MNKISTLYVYELKKIAKRKIVWITGIIMLILCLFLGFSDLVSTSTYYGETAVSGYEAMKINKNNAKSFSGRVIDDTLLREMQVEYRNRENGEIINHSSPQGGQVSGFSGSYEDNENVFTGKYAPIHSYVQQIINDRDLTLDISSDELYATREKEISQSNTDQKLTEEENTYWASKELLIQKPFVYEYTDGWSNIWTYAYTVNYILFLFLAICLSSTFSIEHLRKTDAIILCSQYGKTRLYFAKILAGITFGITSAILFFGTTALSSIFVYGADGFHAALQIAFPMSSWAVSVGESILIFLLTFVAISVLYSSTIMVLSELLKNSVAVMAIPVGTMILTMMIDIPYQFRIASQIYDLLPTNLLVAWELWDNRLISVFGKYFTNYQIAPIAYLTLAILLAVVGKIIYQKHQIYAR